MGPSPCCLVLWPCFSSTDYPLPPHLPPPMVPHPLLLMPFQGPRGLVSKPPQTFSSCKFRITLNSGDLAAVCLLPGR